MYRSLVNIISHIEETTHVDLHYLAKGFAWLASGQVVLSLLAMVSAIAFANLLTTDTFGHYRFILSIVGILSLATLTGMDTAFMRAASRGYERTLYPILKKRISFGLLGTLGAVFGSLYYFLNDNSLLGSALLLAAFFLPFKDTLAVYISLLQARRQFGRTSVYRVLTQIVSISSLVLVLWFSNSLLLLLFAYFASNTFMHLAFLRHTLRQDSPKGGADRNAITYGYHLSFLRGLGSLSGNAYSIALFHFVGAASLAQFYFAIAPMEQARALVGHIETLLFPKIAKDSWHLMSFKSFFRRLFPFLLVLSALTGAYIVAAPFLFQLLFPQYTNAVLISQLYAPSIVVTAMNTVLLTILKSKGLIKIQYILNIYEAIFSFAVIIPAIIYFNMFGLVGGILAMKTLEFLGGSLLLFRYK